MQNIDYTKKEEIQTQEDLQGCVYEEHSVYIPPFLEGFRHRISQITMSCMISRKFFCGKK